jgi:hypothetical protein
MRKAILIATVLLFGVSSAALAKNFAFPEKNPSGTVSIPDTWSTEEIEYGYSAKSPGEDVFFSVEFAGGSRLDKMLDNNVEWMKENEIEPKGKPVEKEIEINGIPAKLLHFDATDGDGDTTVDFVFISGGSGRVTMFTLWGSAEEIEANQADIDSIKKSIKAIN